MNSCGGSGTEEGLASAAGGAVPDVTILHRTVRVPWVQPRPPPLLREMPPPSPRPVFRSRVRDKQPSARAVVVQVLPLRVQRSHR